MVRTVVVAGLVLIGTGLTWMAGTPAQSAETGRPAAVWADVEGTAEDILQRREEDWATTPGRYDPLDARSRSLNRLLDRAVERLSQGEAMETRDRIAALRTELAALEGDIAELRAGLAALPAERCDAAGTDASWVERQIACAFATSRTEQIQRIAEKRQRADAVAAQIDTLKNEFAERMAAIGIRLTPEQTDGLLRVATAGDLVAAHTVYENLRAVNDELQRATVADDESVDVARRYYGVYAVLLEVALHMHERFLDTVRHEHLPRLAAIAEEAAAARAEARALRARQTDAALAAQLDANVKALDTTLKAASLYRRTLNEQVGAMTAAWARVERQHAVAVNTWRTVRASSDMLAMMGESGRAFDSLLSLELPAPRAFDNVQLQREFERLTDRLVAEERG